MAADDLALFTHRLHRRSYLHDPFRLMIQTGWLWRPGRPPLPCPRSGSHAEASRLRARQSRISKVSLPPVHLLRPCKRRVSAASREWPPILRQRRLESVFAPSSRHARRRPPHRAYPDRRPRLRGVLARCPRSMAARRPPTGAPSRRAAAAPGCSTGCSTTTRTRIAGSSAPGATRATGSSCSSGSRPGRPVEAVYAQHSGAERCGFGAVTPRRAARRVRRPRLARLLPAGGHARPDVARPQRRGRISIASMVLPTPSIITTLNTQDRGRNR